jgi:predicted HD phosphohydrolase
MKPQSLNSTNVVSFLTDIFQRRGSEEYLGEPVTMEQHMLQAAHYAAAEGEDDIVIVAALLHDIGHFTSEFGSYSPDDTKDRFHETAGAEALEGLFPSLVIDCIRYHVAAKRYLCAVDSAYFDKLSAASVHSLSLQGGPMSDAEVEQFKRHEHLNDIVKVRLYDDAGKNPTLEVKPFSYYRPMVQRVGDQYHRQYASLHPS